MRDDVKLRLYVTAIVIVMAILCVGPQIVNSHFASVRQELLSSCFMERPGLGFDFCWQDAEQKAALPLWEYLLPYLPAAALLWVNWLLKPSLKFSAESYPTRTIRGLVWLGLFAAAVGIYVSIENAVTGELSKAISFLRTLYPLWLISGWLIAPLMFHHLLAPVASVPKMKNAKIGLILLAITPIVAVVVVFIREGLRALG